MVVELTLADLTEVHCLPQIFGLESLLGSDALWPVLLALTILPAVLQSIMLPFCPESPRYLLIVLNEEEKARKGEFIACSDRHSQASD